MKKIWAKWIIVAAVIGGVISTIIMILFYFTAFLLFAVPFRLFGKDLLKRNGAETNWRNKIHTPSSLKELQEEF